MAVGRSWSVISLQRGFRYIVTLRASKGVDDDSPPIPTIPTTRLYFRAAFSDRNVQRNNIGCGRSRISRIESLIRTGKDRRSNYPFFSLGMGYLVARAEEKRQPFDYDIAADKGLRKVEEEFDESFQRPGEI